MPEGFPFPIVYISRTSTLLRQVVEVSQLYNPGTEIIVLGKGPHQTSGQTSFIPLEKYSEAADELARQYVHRSEEAREKVLFEMQSWLILHEFMSKQNIQGAFVADDNVIITANLSELYAHYRYCDLTLAFGRRGWRGHASFVNHLAALEGLCLSIQRYYTPFAQERLQKTLEMPDLQDRGQAQGLLPFDMQRILAGFCDRPEIMVVNTCEIIQGCAFDYCLGSAETGYAMLEGRKRLSWCGDIVYAQHERLGVQVRMVALNTEDIDSSVVSLLCEEAKRARTA